jgi:WD40 repeat protein
MILQDEQTKKQQKQWTPLARDLLMVIGQQYALRIDHVPRFLALRAVQSDHEPKANPKSAAHNLVERLRRAGLIHVRRFSESKYDWIWLTKKGWQELGLDSTWNHPHRAKLRALHAANTIRLLLTEHDPQVSWISHEQLCRADLPRNWYPLPTAELLTGTGECIAIHETSRLTGTDEQIMTRIREHLERETSLGKPYYTALWYYATAPVAARLRAARTSIAETLGKEMARRVFIFSFPPIPKQVLYRGHHTAVQALIWSGNGRYLASADMETVQVWDAGTGKEQFRLATESLPSHIGWSCDGSWIALAETSGKLSFWEGVTGEPSPITVEHFDSITGLAWSPVDNEKIAWCGQNGSLEVYDIRQQIPFWSSGYLYLQGAESLSWSPDGERLAVGGSKPSVSLFHAMTGRHVETYRKHHAAVRTLAWSPDSQLLASASDGPAILIWEATSGKKRRTIRSGLSMINALAWSPDGSRLACAGCDPRVEVWHVQSGRLLFTYPDHADAITSLAWSPNGALIASASEDGTVQVYAAEGSAQ